MENIEPDETASVRGLLDSERVATYLGVPRNTIRSWEKRKNDGKPGVHAKFPNPLPERLGGTTLWDAEDIKAFKPAFDELQGGGAKKDTPKSATGLLQTDTVDP